MHLKRKAFNFKSGTHSKTYYSITIIEPVEASPFLKLVQRINCIDPMVLVKKKIHVVCANEYKEVKYR